jgi:hypothetical protein
MSELKIICVTHCDTTSQLFYNCFLEAFVEKKIISLTSNIYIYIYIYITCHTSTMRSNDLYRIKPYTGQGQHIILHITLYLEIFRIKYVIRVFFE